MKQLLITILISACGIVTAQKPVFNTYFDTAYWFSADADTAEFINEPIFILDTASNQNYGKYSQFALKYAQSIMGTKVGDGLCGRVGERMCEMAHAQMVLKGRVTGTDMSSLEVGDIIVFPQFLMYGPGPLAPETYSPAEHMAMFLGMKNDSTIIIAHQNTENRTFSTKVVLWEVNVNAMKFFKGNSHQVYFDVYGYQPRKVLKKEYAFLLGK